MALAVLIVASAMVTLGLSRLRGRAAWGLAAIAIGSAIVLMQVPQLARLLHLSPLHREDWIIALASGLATGLLSAVFAHEPRRPGVRLPGGHFRGLAAAVGAEGGAAPDQGLPGAAAVAGLNRRQNGRRG